MALAMAAAAATDGSEQAARAWSVPSVCHRF